MDCADRAESREWRTDHLHIKTAVKEQLGFDVIVFQQSPAPPRPVRDE